jgi:four helix bundle protein
MAKIERFEDLEIWKEAVAIGIDIYTITSKGKLEKDYSSKDQLRRAAISISNNIAEGFEYNNNIVFVRFLGYPKGSAGELRSNLFVLKEAGVVSKEDYKGLHDKISNRLRIQKRKTTKRNKFSILQSSNFPIL